MAKSRVVKYDWTPALLFCVLKRVCGCVCFAILCYCFHQKSLLFFLWRKHFCAVTLSRSFSFHLQKKTVLTSSLPPVYASVCLCVCSQDIQVECFSSNAFSSWRTVDFRRWGLWIGIFRLPAPTRSPTHVNTERNNNLHSNFVAVDSQQTAHFSDGALPYTEITFKSGQQLCFLGPHNYLVVATVVERLRPKHVQCLPATPDGMFLWIQFSNVSTW